MSKSVLHAHCLSLLQDRRDRLQGMIDDAQKAASDDTKSSAGDKFETGREMMKREIDKYSLQLSQAEKQLRFLGQLDPSKSTDSIQAGSLVHTSEGTYYFSVPLGKVSLEGQSYFSLSMVAPIGKALKGKRAGEVVSFMKRDIRVERVE